MAGAKPHKEVSMKTNLMRKIDYYVGIPVCFIFSCFHSLSRLLFKKDRTITNPGKVLFIKFFGLGTIVLATPALKRCQQFYPDAELHLLTFEENRRIFDLITICQEIKVHSISSSSMGSFLYGTLKTLVRLREERFDVVIDLEFFSRFTSIISFLSRSRCRIGFYNYFIEGLYRGDFLTHKVFYNHYQHTSLAFLDMIESMRMGSALPYHKIQNRDLVLLREAGIHFTALGTEREKIRDKFQLDPSERLVLLNPNVSEGFIDLRRWPLTHFANLAGELLRNYPDVRIGIIGSENDTPTAKELEQLIDHARVTNFAGKTSLAELCQLLDSSLCLVTNDSGPAHLAALADIPVITLFGPDTPSLFSPLAKQATSMFLQLGCSPCGSIYNGKRTVCQDNQCLKLITPEMVYQAVVREL
jgi:lipopolysaccharide heptosyltransferase II